MCVCGGGLHEHLSFGWKTDSFNKSCILTLHLNVLKAYINVTLSVHKLILTSPLPPGLLFSRTPLHSNQPVQTGLCWWQQVYRTALCAPGQFHSSQLGSQCDGSPRLASSQLPQAAGVSRGPVLRGRLPFSWFHLRAGSLPLHQQQGGSTRVRLLHSCTRRNGLSAERSPPF